MNRKQLFMNLFATVLSFLVGIGINFFFTPYLLNIVGAEAYGFVPLVGNFISYTAIFSTALNSMASRFISIKVNQGNFKAVNSYFNTVLFSNLILSSVLGILFIIITIKLEYFINIPIKQEREIKLLFGLTFLGSIIALMASVYSIATFCKNRMDLKANLTIGESLIRVFSLIILFKVFPPQITYIGVASLLMSLFVAILNIIYTKKLLPEVKIDIRLYNIKIFKKLIKSGIWNSITQLSSILLTGLDLLITNLFIGVTEAGLLGIVKIIPNLLFSFASLFVSVFSPQFVILYAKNKIDFLIKEIQFSLKILGLIIGIPIGGFIVFGDIFYSLWIPGEDAILLQKLSIITLLGFIVSCSTLTLNNIYTVTNKLKLPAIIVFISACLSTVTVFILLLNTNLGIFAIAGVSSVIGIFRNLLFDPIYAAKCLNLKWNIFYKYIFQNLLSVLIVILIGLILRYLCIISSWGSLIIVSGITTCLSLIVNFYCIITKKERKKIIMNIMNVFKNKGNKG